MLTKPGMWGSDCIGLNKVFCTERAIGVAASRVLRRGCRFVGQRVPQRILVGWKCLAGTIHSRPRVDPRRRPMTWLGLPYRQWYVGGESPTMKKQAWKIWAFALLTAAALGAWVRFLVGQTVEDAGQWSAIVALPVATVLSLVAIIVAWLAWKKPQNTQESDAAEPGVPRIQFHAGRDTYIANEMNIKQRNNGSTSGGEEK